MANSNDDYVFGNKVGTPKGKLVFFDIDSPNTQAKNPKNKYPSDRYDVTMMFPKDTNLSKLQEECNKVALDAFGTTDGIEMPFANGNEKSLDYMAGHIVIRAKSKKRPGLIDETKEIISETELSGGSWARMTVTPMSYKSGKTKGITFLLKNVQALTHLDYESLGGGGNSNPADDFDDDIDEV